VVEIYDIVGKEDVDGEPHYWVKWRRGLWLQDLRHDSEHKKGGKGRGRLPPSKAGQAEQLRERAPLLAVVRSQEYAGSAKKCARTPANRYTTSNPYEYLHISHSEQIKMAETRRFCTRATVRL
jgi:hypothetical protein